MTARKSRATASLSGVHVKRTKPAVADGKDGDITSQIASAIAAVEQLAAPEPAPKPPAKIVDEPPPRAEEIVVYWERLRRGRPYPALGEVDRSLVGKGWPDSLIVLFERDPSVMPRISRLGTTDGEIEYTPMVTDWILTRARQTARRAVRSEEVQTFPMDDDTPRYRLFLLPLGGAGGGADGVLCHLCRVF